ncbi:hypothetical protein [Stieleria marina]|uniref:Nudix hydrolase domain-containing protein n=1 Tax=Stieleria marina TaxID=1930275 RepID=A0A517P283_9BACT|nr:hypothetical protein K239x_55110 [Planctomycetes bacterium K23_9]
MLRVRLILLLLCLPLVVGCEGCRQDVAPPEQDKEEEPLQEFSSKPALSYPADSNLGGNGIKPGHWMTAAQTLKSNKADARGELLTQSSVVKSDDLGGGGITNQQDGIQSLRPIVLPKGQQRRFDVRLLTPKPSSIEQRKLYLSSRFVSAGRSTSFDTGRQPFNVMIGQEYFFVILTNRPERFAAFQVADWVKPLRGQYEFQTAKPNYRVVMPNTENVLAIPETMLDLSSTAVVLWDNLGPESLTPQQMTALSDWVRFGGHLIVNGADASDAISKTQIGDLLPLIPTSNIELDPDAAVEMLTNWQVKTDRTTKAKIESIRSQTGRIAVDGKLVDGAEAVPNSGNLIVQRRIGLGRVVQPRFDVTGDWLQDWDSYNSFVNSVLLMRPRREMIESRDPDAESMFSQLYADYGTTASDAAFNTHFRLTARDAVLAVSKDGKSLAVKQTHAMDPYTFSSPVTGIGAWTDDSDAVSLCQEILREESGIEIPDSSLVVRSLGYYLLLLVPINYLFFRLIGKLEYAWLAVPFIAIGGAIWVARAARLDIGFARSQTELAILELQPEYQRGHLSRVIAIYNSLSSTYDFDFKTYDAAAMPMIDSRSSDDSIEGCTFKTSFGEGPTLSGISVGSNRIRLVHCEQMIDLGGAITRNQNELLNGTKQELYDAFVLTKSPTGELQIASVGMVPAQSSAALKFDSSSEVSVSDELPMQAARLIKRLASPVIMPPGSSRLVARIDNTMSDLTITPAANQTAAQTIVLAHLEHAPLPIPQPDVNLLSDFRRVQTGQPSTNDDE